MKPKIVAIVALVSMVLLLLALSLIKMRKTLHPTNSNAAVSPRQEPKAVGAEQPAEISKEVSGLHFDTTVVKDIDQAFRNSSTDPVSAALQFKSVLESKKQTPDQMQSQWLKDRIQDLQPKALAMLGQDLNHARETQDARSLLLTIAIANKLQPDALGQQDPSSAIKDSLLSGSNDSAYIWRITEAKATLIPGAFTEDGGIGSQGITLTPKEGHQFLRVHAHIKNLSNEADKPYTLWAVGDVKRSFAAIFDRFNKPDKPYRWLDDGFIYLLSATSEMYACVHVCAGSKLRDSSLTVTSPDGSGGIITTPQRIVADEDFELDVLFAIPRGASGWRLLVLGAPPAELR